MAQYRVHYSLGQYANPNNSLSSFSGYGTHLQDLKIIVTAATPGQARQIVEGQFGGAGRCVVSGVYTV
jgi:hypothetical protein